MRITEVLTELLDSAITWKLTSASRLARKYSWSIGELHYELLANADNEEDDPDRWEVSFVLLTPNAPQKSKTEKTGTGNELQVFSTVLDIIMNDLIPATDPDTVWFSAARYEQNVKTVSRTKLYTRLINKYLPAEYSVESFNVGGESPTEFYISKR